MSTASEAQAGEQIVRFSLKQRIEHIVTMVTFVGLCVTGLPQKFYTSDWAQGMVGLFGGIDATRWIHRFFGVTLAISVVVHLFFAMAAVASPAASAWVIGSTPATSSSASCATWSRMAESCPAKAASSSGDRRSLASRAIRRTSSSDSAIRRAPATARRSPP